VVSTHVQALACKLMASKLFVAKNYRPEYTSGEVFILLTFSLFLPVMSELQTGMIISVKEIMGACSCTFEDKYRYQRDHSGLSTKRNSSPLTSIVHLYSDYVQADCFELLSPPLSLLAISTIQAEKIKVL
jgi:hypothetical protein